MKICNKHGQEVDEKFIYYDEPFCWVCFQNIVDRIFDDYQGNPDKREERAVLCFLMNEVREKFDLEFNN